MKGDELNLPDDKVLKQTYFSEDSPVHNHGYMITDISLYSQVSALSVQLPMGRECI